MNNVFIEGEKINLCVPDNEDFLIWANWFNSCNHTRFLEQGKLPNTVEQQINFYKDSQNSGRFITLIKTKKNQLLGVISLSEINYEKSSCQISLVCPVKSKDAPYAALEAMALATEHAFVRFGLNRVWAGQAYPGLKKWSQYLECIGFKTEGVIRDGFVHGINITPAINISVIKKDFLVLIERRNGKLWPTERKVQFLINKLKKREPLAEKVNNFLITAQHEQDEILLNLETTYEQTQ